MAGYLILNGPRRISDRLNPCYRGTWRSHPTYCDGCKDDDEINQLFFWFLEEGGELALVQNLHKAARFCDLWNRRLPIIERYEVVEVAVGQWDKDHPGKFYGYDIASGFNCSLLATGLAVFPDDRNASKSQTSKIRSVHDSFRPSLNEYGLFNHPEVALECRKGMVEVQELYPGTYEGCSLDSYEVVGVCRVHPDGSARSGNRRFRGHS